MHLWTESMIDAGYLSPTENNSLKKDLFRCVFFNYIPQRNNSR